MDIESERKDKIITSFRTLSRRQRAIVLLAVKEEDLYSVAEMAGIAVATAKVHLRAAYAKMGCQDKRELALLLLSAGVIKPLFHKWLHEPSPAEVRILRVLAVHTRTKQIARSLGRAVGTIKTELHLLTRKVVTRNGVCCTGVHLVHVAYKYNQDNPP